MTTNAERLARWPADDDICLGKYGFSRQRNLLTFTFEILPVSSTSISILLISKRIKSLRLETQG